MALNPNTEDRVGPPAPKTGPAIGPTSSGPDFSIYTLSSLRIVMRRTFSDPQSVLRSL